MIPTNYLLALTWGAYAIGLISSLFAYVYLRRMCYFIFHLESFYHVFLVTAPSFNSSGQYTAPVLLFAFLIGAQCCKSWVHISNVRLNYPSDPALTLSSAIEAGVSTM